MTAHEIDNIASPFPESLSESQISKINEKAILGLGIFQSKVLLFFS